MDLLSTLNNKRHIRGILIFIFLLIAIPLTIYLVYQQQIFKSKALGEGSTLQAYAANFAALPDNNPQDGIPETQTQIIGLKLTWNPGAAQLSPTRTPTPTSSAPTATSVPGQPTLTPVLGRCPNESDVPTCGSGLTCVSISSCNIGCNVSGQTLCYNGQNRQCCSGTAQPTITSAPGVPTAIPGGRCANETSVPTCGSGLDCVPTACGVSCSGSSSRPNVCYTGSYRLCCSVQVPTLTVSPNLVQLGYGSMTTFTVSWTGVNPANATDLYWIIRDDKNLGVETYLGTCSKTPPSSISLIPNSGSCTISPPLVENYYTYKLYHFVPPSSVTTVATSSQVTVLRSPF